MNEARKISLAEIPARDEHGAQLKIVVPYLHRTRAGGETKTPMAGRLKTDTGDMLDYVNKGEYRGTFSGKKYYSDHPDAP
jgi:hypothetical protein